MSGVLPFSGAELPAKQPFEEMAQPSLCQQGGVI